MSLPAGRQAWVQFAWRVEVLFFNNKLFSMNLFRFVYFENYQRRNLAPIR
jgi:hypothetical protein